MKKINFKSVNLQLLVVIFLFIALNVAIYLSGKNADNRNRAAGASVCVWDSATSTTICTSPTNTPVPLPTYGCTADNTGNTCIGRAADANGAMQDAYCQWYRDASCKLTCTANCGIFGFVTPGASACAVGMASNAICSCSTGGKGHMYQDKYCNSECVCDGVAVPTQYLPPSTSGSPGAGNYTCPSGITRVGNSLCFSSTNGDFSANLYNCPPGSDISAGCQQNPKQLTGSTICMNNTVCGVQQLDVVGAGAGKCYMTSNSNTSASCAPATSSGTSVTIPTAAPLPTIIPTRVIPTNTPTLIPSPTVTMTPTATPKVCVVPTPPVCTNGTLLQKKTPDGCPEYVCVPNTPTPTRVPSATPTPKVCVIPTPPVCTNGTLLQKSTPDGCPIYVCVINTPTMTSTPTATATKIPTATPTRVPTATMTPAVCKNCQYQADLFWGPVIKSFAGGVRYGTLNRLITSVNTNTSTSGYAGCQLEPVSVLGAPAVPALSLGCSDPVAKKYLVGSIDSSKVNLPGGYILGKVTNTTSNCTYDVGLASYKANGTSIDNQNLYDYKTEQIGPNQTFSFVVKSPMINDQISCHNIPQITPTAPICTVPTPKDPPTMSCDNGSGGTVTWKWANVAGATQYEVDIYKTDGTKVVDNGWVAGSSYSCSTGTCSYKTTLPAGGYYSMIRATGSGACEPSAWARSKEMLVDICPPVSCNKNLDIAIVIDRSGSMARYKEPNGLTKLQMAKNAALKVVNAVKSTGSTSVKFSVVSYGAQGNDGRGTLASGYNATLNSSLTNNYGSVSTAINNVNFLQDLTCIQCGIRIANKQLTNVANRRVEILLSDGIANRSWNGVGNNSSYPAAITDAINEAVSGRAAGIEYRVLGYGDRMLGMTVDGGINEKSLTSIAGSTVNYSYSPDATVWSNSFMQVVKDLCR